MFWTMLFLPISKQLSLISGRKGEGEKGLNVEHRTSNIKLAIGEQALDRLRRFERITGKNEETEIRSGRETFRIFRKGKNNSTLDVRLFARSKLDVESSTLDVHLFTRSKLMVS